MKDLLTTLALGFVSALVPVVNIEAYLAVRAAVTQIDAIWALALVAALGQMAGKFLWYRLGASSLGWAWVRRKIEKPKVAASLELWRSRTHQRPVLTGVLVLAAAIVGLPPLAILAVVAGQLRMSLMLFLGLGLLGRWLRFVGLLSGVAWAGQSGLGW
jgi:membrane protein YqaA with SNARE-associated domain